MTRPIQTVLGIDAAWTEKEPSGVALLTLSHGRWKCCAVTPSYQSFIDFSRGKSVEWGLSHRGTVPNPAALLAAAHRIASADVDLVTIDMPISRDQIRGRRAADDAVAKEFGSRWCAAHSPNETRPGKLGHKMTTEFESLGFLVATTDTAAQTPRHLVEVYPHPALLALLNREVRVPYKVAKSTRYWRGTALRQRIELLLTEFTAIFEGLQQAIGRIPLTIPRHSNVSRITHLKRFEDALDAIVSAWVGTVYAAGDAVPLGDARAAIWCPSAAIRSKDQVQ